MASLIEEMKVFGMSERANSHDRAANRRSVLLEVAYKLFAKQVYALSLRLLANVRDAEDVTVDVFAKFNRELPRRWDESRVLDRLRELAIAEALRRLRECPSERINTQVADRRWSPANISEKRGADGDGNATVRSPLVSENLAVLTNKLPDDLRLAFVLHDIEGLSNQAVARHLRSDEADVRKLVRNARLALRRLWLSQK